MLSAEDLESNLNNNPNFVTAKSEQLDIRLQELKLDVFDLLKDHDESKLTSVVPSKKKTFSKNIDQYFFKDSIGSDMYNLTYADKSKIIRRRKQRKKKRKKKRYVDNNYDDNYNNDEINILDDYDYGFNGGSNVTHVGNSSNRIHSRAFSGVKLRRLEKQIRKEKILKYQHENEIRSLKRENDQLKNQVNKLKHYENLFHLKTKELEHLKKSFYQSEEIRRSLTKEMMYSKRN